MERFCPSGDEAIPVLIVGIEALSMGTPSYGVCSAEDFSGMPDRGALLRSQNEMSCFECPGS